jgi:hypothetical protein
MHDFKNILLAWLSSTSAVLTAIEAKTFITIVSAIVLPTIFFALGKAVDVCLQIHLRRRANEERHGAEEARKPNNLPPRPSATPPNQGGELLETKEI